MEDVHVRVLEEDAPRPRAPVSRPLLAGLAVVVIAVLIVVLVRGDDPPRVVVLNGTTVPGLDRRAAARVGATAAGDASARDLRRTRVVALTAAGAPVARALRRRLHAAGASRLRFRGQAPRGTDVLVVVGRDRVPPPRGPAGGPPRVAVLDGVGVPGEAARAAAVLRRAGFPVLGPVADPEPGAPETMVGAVDPRFAAEAGQLRRRLDAAPLTPDARAGAVPADADVVLVLGGAAYVPPLARTVPRVRVVNQSGSGIWGVGTAGDLRRRGFRVTDVVSAGRAFRTRIVPLGGDAGPAREVAAAIGQPGAVDERGANPDGGSANVAVFLGTDLPGGVLLESHMGIRGSACRPGRRVRTYVCEDTPRRVFDVRVRPGGAWVATRRGSGAVRRGTGATP